MSLTSKLTVKHFLNTLLAYKSTYEKVEDGHRPEDFPGYFLYIKIIFRRKTTQIRSKVLGRFLSLEEANSKHGKIMKLEIKMIEDLIQTEYKQEGDKFELKGIVNKIAYYQQDILNLVFYKFLWDDFIIFLLKSRSEYMRLLYDKDPKIPALTYYNAALKLIGNSEELIKIKPNFEKYQLMEYALFQPDFEESFNFTNWIYGDLKNRFAIKLLEKRVSINEVSELVEIIDGLFKKYYPK